MKHLRQGWSVDRLMQVARSCGGEFFVHRFSDRDAGKRRALAKAAALGLVKIKRRGSSHLVGTMT